MAVKRENTIGYAVVQTAVPYKKPYAKGKEMTDDRQRLHGKEGSTRNLRKESNVMDGYARVCEWHPYRT